MTCVLCDSKACASYADIGGVNYQQCQQCDLIFMNPQNRFDAKAEKARYEKHENNVLDDGYQKFVAPLISEITQKVSPDSLGLDFGSGPEESAVSYLLQKQNYSLKKYDPFFLNDPSVLQHNTYDYVVSCEVVEHLYSPKEEFKKLKSYLKPNGFLFLMTSLKTDTIDFKTWSYRRDQTHVCFYSEKSMQFIKNQFGFKTLSIQSNHQVIALQ